MPVKVVETGEPGFKLGTEEPEGEAVGDETKISFGCLLPKYKIPPIKAKTATAVSAKIFLLAKIEDFGGTTILPAGGAGFSGIFGSGLDMLCPGKGEVLFSAVIQVAAPTVPFQMSPRALGVSQRTVPPRGVLF